MVLRPKPKPIIPNDLHVVQTPIDQIKPDPSNARRHSPAQIKALARSITEFGFLIPILLDARNQAICGHGRLAASKHLGLTTVPTIRADHLTEAQAKAFNIADNRLTDLSDWNEELLAKSLKSLASLDLTFDQDVIGFSIGEIDIRIESLNGPLLAGAEDPDDRPLPIGPAICKLGDLWTAGAHRILCGDALEAESYARLLNGASVQAMFTDPPYNVAINGHARARAGGFREFASAVGEMTEDEFTSFLVTAMRLAADHSDPGSVHFIFMDWKHVGQLLTAGGGVYHQLLNICVWAKDNGGMGSLYRSAHELVAVYRHGSAPHRNNVQLGKYGRNRTNVWSYPGANTFLRSGEDADLTALHPTPKPVAMVADAILDVTTRGDLVLDGFLGSGASLLGCERTGRGCRAIELDPLYVDCAIRRWQRHTGQDAVLEATGQTFNSLVAEAGR